MRALHKFFKSTPLGSRYPFLLLLRWGILTLCMTVFSSFAWGYAFNKASNGKPRRWHTLPVNWYLNMNGFTRVKESDTETAFKNAFLQWSKQTCTNLTTKYMGKTTSGKTGRDRKNVLTFGYVGGVFSSTNAVTTTTFSNDKILDADIVFRNTRPWSVNPSSKENDLRGTATHEVGHLFGLAHSSVLSSTMYKSGKIGPSPRRILDADDIKGICILYPSSSGGCSSSADCPSNHTCSSGKCIPNTSGCRSNSDCPSGNVCSGGKCVPAQAQCRSNTDCPANSVCTNGKCVPKPPGCRSDRDCRSGYRCSGGKCVPSTPSKGQRGDICGRSAGGKQCDSGMVCVSKGSQPAYCLEYCSSGACPNGGKCLRTTSGTRFCACDSDGDCGANQFCKNRNCFNKPTGCTSDSQCGAGLRCQAGKCVKPQCTQDNHCPSGQECKQEKCVPKTTPPYCRSNSDCPSGKKCLQGRCIEGEPPCTTNSQCQSGFVCKNGKCVQPQTPPKGFGQPCSDNTECASQRCIQVPGYSIRFCSKGCLPNVGQCPAGYECSSSGSHQGLCVPKSTTPPVEPATSQEPSVRPEPTVTTEPTAKNGEEKGGISPDAGSNTPTRPSTGCQCSSAAQTEIPWSLWIVALCLFGFAFRKRTQRG